MGFFDAAQHHGLLNVVIFERAYQLAELADLDPLDTIDVAL